MLSEKDNQLLALLRSNARISVSDLSRALSLSRSTVQNRLNKLEQSGVIKGYAVEFGSQYQAALVCSHVAIKVKQKLTAKTNLQLRQLSQVAELYAISGEFDLIAVVQAESLEQLNKILDDIANLEGVERTNSSVILETKFKR
ncbi:MAG: Lrp/AsnC family transcriptional regulator [Paraglaciecola sp.]|jgi:DNA-binding Lrp family transcriptional regulator|nr:Lrp/AsnC family transcriptional regulator [Paraglaciecola sp.]NCT49178.1 Lrp/AsnC family transcriptional regulator [Paraglaciecola sp.]